MGLLEKRVSSDFLVIMLLMTLITRMERIRELFKIKANKILSFERDGNYAKVKQEFIRDDNTLGEFLNNPSLLFMPRTFTNYLEYSFLQPCFFLQSPNKFMEIHLLYPETENRTKTFVPMPNSRIRS